MRLSFSIFLAALPLILSACFVDVPDPHDGVFACQSDEDCANDFYCEYSRTENPNDGLCMPHGNDDANTGDGTCDDICPFPETCVEGACVFDESACVPANVPVNSNFGWCPYDLPCFDGICVANEPGCGQDGDPLQCEYEGQACKQEGWCWGDDGSGNAVYCSLDGEVDHQKCQTLIDKDSFCAAYPTCIDTDECNGCGFPYLCDATIDPPTCTYDNTIFCWANNPQGKCPPDSYCIGGACYINNTECESGTIEGDTCTDSTSVCQPVGRCTDEYNQTCYPYSDEGHFSCRSENDITSNYCAVYLECVSPDGCATHEDCITNNAGNICMDAKCKWTCYSGGDYCPPNYSCEDTLDNKTRCVHNNNECSPQNNTCDGQSCFWNSVCVDPWGNMGEPCAPDYNCPNNQNCVPNYSCRDMSCFTYEYPIDSYNYDDHCAALCPESGYTDHCPTGQICTKDASLNLSCQNFWTSGSEAETLAQSSCPFTPLSTVVDAANSISSPACFPTDGGIAIPNWVIKANAGCTSTDCNLANSTYETIPMNGANDNRLNYYSFEKLITNGVVVAALMGDDTGNFRNLYIDDFLDTNGSIVKTATIARTSSDLAGPVINQRGDIAFVCQNMTTSLECFDEGASNETLLNIFVGSNAASYSATGTPTNLSTMAGVTMTNLNGIGGIAINNQKVAVTYSDDANYSMTQGFNWDGTDLSPGNVYESTSIANKPDIAPVLARDDSLFVISTYDATYPFDSITQFNNNGSTRKTYTDTSQLFETLHIGHDILMVTQDVANPPGTRRVGFLRRGNDGTIKYPEDSGFDWSQFSPNLDGYEWRIMTMEPAKLAGNVAVWAKAKSDNTGIEIRATDLSTNNTALFDDESSWVIAEKFDSQEGCNGAMEFWMVDDLDIYPDEGGGFFLAYAVSCWSAMDTTLSFRQIRTRHFSAFD